jgi:hypothetical protein
VIVADCYRQLDRLISRLGPAPADRELHYIDYAHRVGAVFYHGSVSDLNGTVHSTWTFEDGGQLVTRDQVIEPETFQRLWSGIAQLPVFRRATAGNMSAPLDPVGHHVVSIVFTENRQFGRCVFLVAADEADEAFGVWLGLLNRPGSSA